MNEYNDLTIEEITAIKPIMEDILHGLKDNEQEAYLNKKFKEYLPEKSEEEIAEYTKNIIETIDRNNDNLEKLDKAKEDGQNRETFFANETRQILSRVSMEQSVQFYASLSEAVQNANKQMYNTVITQNNTVNMNPNLDGFIAETHHVNTYNLDSAVKQHGSIAEVVEHKGEAFTKNGVDTRIIDKSGHIESKYQAKYGKDSKATDKMFFDKDGNYKYSFEQKLVPEGQNISGKSTSVMQSKDGKVHSTSLTKEEAKQMQVNAQKNGNIKEYSFNDYQMKDLAIGVGKQTANAGILGAAISAGSVILEKTIQGEEVTSDAVIEAALVGGADASVKVATAGALTIAVEKGLIKAIPKGTPADVVANVAFIAVENAKIACKVANGEITAKEGLSRMCDVTVSAATGLAASFVAGFEIGAVASLIFSPPVGVVVGVIASTIGYIAGSKVGQAISKGIKAVGKAAVGFVKTVGKEIIDAGRTIVNTAKSAWNTVKSTASKAWSNVKSFFSR